MSIWEERGADRRERRREEVPGRIVASAVAGQWHSQQLWCREIAEQRLSRSPKSSGSSQRRRSESKSTVGVVFKMQKPTAKEWHRGNSEGRNEWTRERERTWLQMIAVFRALVLIGGVVKLHEKGLLFWSAVQMSGWPRFHSGSCLGDTWLTSRSKQARSLAATP